MPEKTLQEVPRGLREQYEKGRVAFEKNNLDYAISLLSQVVEREPGFFECRQALRASQFKKAGVGGKRFFRKLIGSNSPKLLQARLAARNSPLEALNLAEQVLNADPNNLEAHKVLAEAALAADLPKTASLSLEIVLKQSPRDRDVVLKLAGTLAAIGQAARAESFLHDLAGQFPNDPEVAQALKNVSANRTLDEGGYDGLADGQGSYRDILKDEKQSVALEQEQRQHKSDDVLSEMIVGCEAQLRREPDNLRLVRQLAELYTQRKEFDRALEYYQRIQGTQAADPSLEQAIADLQVRKLEHALSQLDPAAPDYAEQTAKIKVAKAEFLLRDCQRRAERYPNDLMLRFELGQLLLQAGRVGEAIAEFQKAQNNPHKRIPSLYYLGQCFARRGMHDLAVRTYQNALKEKTGFDDERKELLYALGVSLDAVGRKAEAMEQFKLIYEADISYGDVAARVDAYYSAQGSG